MVLRITMPVWQLRRGRFAVFGRSVRMSGGPPVNVTEVNRNHAHYVPAMSWQCFE